MFTHSCAHCKLSFESSFSRRRYCSLQCSYRSRKPKPRVACSEKHCKKCNQTKPADAFYANTACVDGLFSSCKECVRAQSVLRNRIQPTYLRDYVEKRTAQDPGWRSRQWRERYKKDPVFRERLSTRAQLARLSSPETFLFRSARSRAHKKGIPFSITEKDIVIPELCPVFGTRLVVATGLGSGGKDDSISLDRITPERGYVPGNVCVISWRANRLKNDASLDELKALIGYVEACLEKKAVAA